MDSPLDNNDHHTNTLSLEALITPGGFRFLRADKILQMTRIDRCQALEDDLFVGDERGYIRAVLMVSHCWETPAHPDPSGRQLVALQEFLKNFEIIREEHASLGFACEPFTTHGRLQAALLYSKMLDHWGDTHLMSSPAAPPPSLKEIAVWYDFMCLPQRQAEGLTDDRSPEERATFRRCLLHLQDMIYSPLTHVLSLRWNDDNYGKRLWCLVEEASPNADGFRQLRLRADCLGEEVSDDDIIMAPYVNKGLQLELEGFKMSARNGWVPGIWKVHNQFRRVDQVSLTTTDIPTSHPPDVMNQIFESLHSMLTPIYVSTTSPHSLDPAGIINQLVNLTGIHVTNNDDRVPVVCMYMSLRYLARRDADLAFQDLASADQNSKLAVLFRNISARYLEQNSTTLVYRQDGVTHVWEFADP